MIANYILMAFDFENLRTDFLDYSMTPFQAFFGIWLWPIIFMWVITLVYMKTQHLSTTVFAILLTFAIWGHTNQFIQAPEFSSFFFLIAVASWAGCATTIFVKKRYES